MKHRTDEGLETGYVEIQYDRQGVLLIDSRDPQNEVNPHAFPRWRFTYAEWEEFLDRAVASRPPT